MTSLLWSRTREIGAKGRTMQLKRKVGTQGSWSELECNFLGKKNAFTPDQVQAGTNIQMGDAQIETLATEFAAFAAANPSWGGVDPIITDRIFTGSTEFMTIKGVDKVWAGELLIGYRIWVKG